MTNSFSPLFNPILYIAKILDAMDVIRTSKKRTKLDSIFIVSKNGIKKANNTTGTFLIRTSLMYLPTENSLTRLRTKNNL